MAQAVKLKNEEQSGATGSMGGAFNRVAEYPRRARQFLHEVRNQMRLVTWPSWNDVSSTTIVVIITVAFFAVYFALTDTILGRVTQWLWSRVQHR